VAPLDLPVLHPTPPGERADARRNRDAILCAAARLIEARGIEHVSMDDVAAEAGVGKGTLYRRFGDRAGLARAMIEAQEAAFQEGFIRGEPPLGPGAPAVDRLHAYGDGVLDIIAVHGDLILAAETGQPGIRYRSSVYQAHRTHVGVLLREALPDTADTDYVADALMAPLSAEVVLHQLRGRGMSLDRIRAGWHSLADCLITGSS
jgi:AcrR family transcriptional regulator